MWASLVYHQARSDKPLSCIVAVTVIILVVILDHLVYEPSEDQFENENSITEVKTVVDNESDFINSSQINPTFDQEMKPIEELPLPMVTALNHAQKLIQKEMAKYSR